MLVIQVTKNGRDIRLEFKKQEIIAIIYTAF
jgi:hypothetical protein